MKGETLWRDLYRVKKIMENEKLQLNLEGDLSWQRKGGRPGMANTCSLHNYCLLLCPWQTLLINHPITGLPFLKEIFAYCFLRLI